MPASMDGWGQWQTLRGRTTASDTLLTSYSRSEGQTNAARLISVRPASGIIIRAFGQDAAAEVATLTISGWMEPSTQSNRSCGPGHRLWVGTATLDGQSRAEPPIVDGVNWPAGTYLEGVFAATTYDALGAEEITSGSGRDMGLLLPTLGYTRILAEITLTTAASVGLIWRPVAIGDMVRTF